MLMIKDLWVSQRRLRNPEQVDGMVRELEDGGFLPKITLVRAEDGQVQVHDGHHRVVAYVLSGKFRLGWGEYTLLEQDDYNRPRFGKVPEFFKRARCV